MGDSLLDLLRYLGQTDPEQADNIMDMLEQLEGKIRERPGLYWDARHPDQGGSGRVLSSPGAPSADHYRLVSSLEEAQNIFGRGERPLLIGNLQDIDPEAIDPNILRKFQEDQWAAPGGVPLFTDQGINPEHQSAWAQGQTPREEMNRMNRMIQEPQN